MTTARREQALMGIILLIGAALRLYKLGDMSLTNDELSALYRLQHPNLWAVWQEGVKSIDFHPAGVQTFLWYWTMWFGTGTFILRLPFVICGITSIWLTYLIGKRWGNATTGLMAAAFMACLSFPILYSRLARPYAPGLLFVLIALWYWTTLMKDKDSLRIKDLIGFALAGALCAYTHYYSALTIAAIGITGLFLVQKAHRLKYMGSGALMLLLFLPHWDIAQAHLSVGGVGGAEGWLPPPKEGWPVEHFNFVFNSLWIAVGLLLVGFAWRVLGQKVKWGVSKWGVIWYILLLSFAVIYSQLVNPIFQDSIMLFAFPALLIGLCWWAMPQVGIRFSLLLPLAALAISAGTTMTTGDPTGDRHFGKFKEIAAAIEEWREEYGKDAIDAAYTFNNPIYMEYYMEGPLDDNAPLIMSNRDLPDLMEHLHTSTAPYFIYAWSTFSTLSEIYPLIRRYYPNTLDDRTYFNSRATLFSRTEGGSPTYGSGFMFDHNDGSWKEDLDPSPFRIEQGTEYFADQQWKISELTQGIDHRPYLTMTMDLDSIAPNAELLIVFEWIRNGKRYRWRGNGVELFPRSINGARTVILTDRVQEDMRDTDVLKLYCWNKSKGQLQVGRLHLRVHDTL